MSLSHQEYMENMIQHTSPNCDHLPPLPAISTFAKLRHPLDLIYRDFLSSSGTNLNIVLSSGCSGFGRGGDFSLE